MTGQGGGALFVGGKGGHARGLFLFSLTQTKRDAGQNPGDHAHAEGSGKAVGKTGERVQDAHRTADENAAEKKMSHDIPVSNDF